MKKLSLASLQTAIDALPQDQGKLLEEVVLQSAYELIEGGEGRFLGPIDADHLIEVTTSPKCKVELDVLVRAWEHVTGRTIKIPE